MSEWVPCSEREPPRTGNYLTTEEIQEYNGEVMRVVYVRAYGIFGWDCPTLHAVIAWQPLPEPYQGELRRD